MKWNGYIYFPACFCCSFWQHIVWWKSNWSGLIVQNKILFHSAQWRPVHQFCDVLRFGWWGIIFYLNQISFHINQSLTGVDKVSMSMAAGMMIMLAQPCTKNMMATVNKFNNLNCQALVPSPVLLDPKPNSNQSKIKIQVQLGLGWHNNHMGHPPTTPPPTFNHEGVL